MPPIVLMIRRRRQAGDPIALGRQFRHFRFRRADFPHLDPAILARRHESFARFDPRQRENRLFSLVLAHPRLLGLGIDEGAGLLVAGGRHAEAVGGQVMVVDGSHRAELRVHLRQRRGRVGNPQKCKHVG